MQQKKKVSQGYEFMFDSIPIVQALAAHFTGLEVPTRLVVKLVGFRRRGWKENRDYSPIMEACKGNIRNLPKFKSKEISSELWGVKTASPLSPWPQPPPLTSTSSSPKHQHNPQTHISSCEDQLNCGQVPEMASIFRWNAKV